MFSVHLVKPPQPPKAAIFWGFTRVQMSREPKCVFCTVFGNQNAQTTDTSPRKNLKACWWENKLRSPKQGRERKKKNPGNAKFWITWTVSTWTSSTADRSSYGPPPHGRGTVEVKARSIRAQSVLTSQVRAGTSCSKNALTPLCSMFSVYLVMPPRPPKAAGASQDVQNSKFVCCDNLFNDADAQRPTAIPRKSLEIGEEKQKEGRKRKNKVPNFFPGFIRASNSSRSCTSLVSFSAFLLSPAGGPAEGRGPAEVRRRGVLRREGGPAEGVRRREGFQQRGGLASVCEHVGAVTSPHLTMTTTTPTTISSSCFLTHRSYRGALASTFHPACALHLLVVRSCRTKVCIVHMSVLTHHNSLQHLPFRLPSLFLRAHVDEHAAASRHHRVESLSLHRYSALRTTLFPAATSWCELPALCADIGLFFFWPLHGNYMVQRLQALRPAHKLPPRSLRPPRNSSSPNSWSGASP